MTMLQLRVVTPDELVEQVVDTLSDRVGVVAVARAADSSDGPVVVADVARESADAVLADLKRIGVCDVGLIALQPLDTTVGELAERAVREAPGEGDDALVWDELTEHLEDDSTLSWTFAAFMVLATMLGAIGVITDSTVTVVGAMVIGPEFGPLAGLAIGLVRKRRDVARDAALALLVGFTGAIVLVTLLALLARAAGLVSPGTLQGHRATDFIYHPGWFSLITALVAGSAGMLSLTSSRSTALVGVFISVTTIPAAGNVAVAAALGDWSESGRSAAQLGINLVGISVAGALLLAARNRTRGARVHPGKVLRAPFA